MESLQQAIAFISQFKSENPSARKAQVQKAYVDRFSPRKARSVFVGEGFAIRFSEARTASFSNTVLSLSALKNHDARPFVVAVVRIDSVQFLLANTTLLKKVSHSSRELRIDNVKGSFNGSDILAELEGIPNAPAGFDQLFALHSAFAWEENLERLVEATNNIIPRSSRFEATAAQRETLLEAPDRAKRAQSSDAFRAVEAELLAYVEERRAVILDAAKVDNVNLRGNKIEQILTGAVNAHDLGDLERDLAGSRLLIDIKSKLLDRASAPKAYNVDKMLAFLAEPNTVFAFLIVGVDTARRVVVARLLVALEESLLEATGVQHHWAGRAARGVTQFSGSFDRALAAEYEPTINVESGVAFLEELLEL